MKNRLGIALRPVAVAGSLHLAAQHGMIVNLAVEDDPDAVVLVRHRLMSAGDVDNGQPSVRKPHRTIEPQPRPIRTPMLLDVGHAHETGAFRPFTHIAFHDTGNGAHRQAASLFDEADASRR